MSTPKKRARRTKEKTTKGRTWLLGPIPDDAFGSASDQPPARGPEARPISIDERFEHLLDNPDLYKLIRKALPARKAGSVGRPLSYPPYIYFLFLCSISVFGSARMTACAMQRGMWWGAVREAVRKHLGPEEANALKAVGPNRSQWNYFFQKHLKKYVASIRDVSQDLWIQQAIDMGMLAENRERGSWIYPERDQVIHGDCTVAHPPSDQTQHETPDKETGEVRRHRVDEDASYTTEGGGRKVYGNKLLAISTRAPNIPHSRVILVLDSVRHKSRKRDPEREDEGTAVVRLVKYLMRKAPGIRAFTYDTALRGVHRAPLITEGLVVYTPQHGGIDPHALLKHVDGKCTHDLYTAEGRVCERRFTVDGETYYTPLPVEELECRKGKKTRFYHRITILCEKKVHKVRIRVDETDEDRKIDPSTKKQCFNRTEHLRQIPPGTPAGRRLKGFRQDSESNHSRFDQAYPLERVPAYGANGALLIYIGYAWVYNSTARTVARRPMGLAA